MNMNIIFSLTLLYNFMHLPCMPDVYEKYLERCQIVKIVPNWSISFV
jgi:hypothetical protein